MPNPTVIDIPEGQAVRIAEKIKGITINRATSSVSYYKIYRLTGDTAPDYTTGSPLPSDAVPIFVNNTTEEIRSSEEIDVYLIARNGDDDNNDTGKIIVGPDNNDRDVNIQDQTTPPIIIKFNHVTNQTNLSAIAQKNSYTLSVDDATGAIAQVVGSVQGSYIILYSSAINRYYTGTVIGISGADLTMDTPLPVEFPAGSNVDISYTNMAVNGSVTPVVFSLRGRETGAISAIADATRFIFSNLSTSAVDLSKFGNLTSLTRGLLARHINQNGETENLFLAKNNREMANLMFDFTPYAATNPAQGQDGFVGRLTFSGQEKMGVALRVVPSGDLEIWIQDDLRGLTLLEIIAQGHFTDQRRL